MSKKKCDCVSMEWCDECCPVKPTPPSDDAGRVGKVVLRQVFEDDEWSDCHPSQFNHMKKCGYKVRELVLASDLDAVTAERDALRQSVVAGAANTRQVADALKALCFAARISGGVAGRDEGLVAACEKAEHALSLLGVGQAVNAAIDVLDQLAASQKECERLREQLTAAVNNPDDPAYWLHSATQALAAGGRHD